MNVTKHDLGQEMTLIEDAKAQQEMESNAKHGKLITKEVMLSRELMVRTIIVETQMAKIQFGVIRRTMKHRGNIVMIKIRSYKSCIFVKALQ